MLKIVQIEKKERKKLSKIIGLDGRMDDLTEAIEIEAL
jgi:hypothetical protein